MARQGAGEVKSLFYFQLRSGLLFLLVTILAIGGGVYHFSQQVLIRTVESNLQTHADFRKGRILAFVGSQKRWMESVSTSPDIVEHADLLWRLYREHGVGSELFQRQSRHFYQEHEVMARAGGVDQLFLLSPDGELLFSLNSGQEDIGADFTSEGMYGGTIFSEVLEQVLQRPQLTISRYGYLEFLEEQTVLMAAPLFSRSAGGEQQISAILVRPMMLDWLRTMLSEYSGLGRTGDVVIAQKELTDDSVQVNFINILRGTAERTEACAALQRAEPEQFPMLRLASVRTGFDGILSGSGWVMDPKCHGDPHPGADCREGLCGADPQLHAGGDAGAQ